MFVYSLSPQWRLLIQDFLRNFRSIYYNRLSPAVWIVRYNLSTCSVCIDNLWNKEHDIIKTNKKKTKKDKKGKFQKLEARKVLPVFLQSFSASQLHAKGIKLRNWQKKIRKEYPFHSSIMSFCPLARINELPHLCIFFSRVQALCISVCWSVGLSVCG